MVKLSDITNDWVKKNFDINKERKTKKTKTKYYITLFDYEFLPHRDRNKDDYSFITTETNLGSIDDVISLVEKEMRHVEKKLKNDGFSINSITYFSNDGYDYLGESPEAGFVFHSEKHRPELDKEVVSRIKSREKSKIKKREKKKELEEKQRKEYERLKKKFGE